MRCKYSVMMLTSDDVKSRCSTGHIPLKDVPTAITTDIIIKKRSNYAENFKTKISRDCTTKTGYFRIELRTR